MTKTKHLIKLLEDNGWEHIRTRGDHRVFKKDGHPKAIVVAGAMSDEVPIGTLKSIMREAGLK